MLWKWVSRVVQLIERNSTKFESIQANDHFWAHIQGRTPKRLLVTDPLGALYSDIRLNWRFNLVSNVQPFNGLCKMNLEIRRFVYIILITSRLTKWATNSIGIQTQRAMAQLNANYFINVFILIETLMAQKLLLFSNVIG